VKVNPDPGFSSFEQAAKAQNARAPISKTRKPAHGGYPGAIPDSREILSGIISASQRLGSDPATCPDCRKDFLCPYHRTH